MANRTLDNKCPACGAPILYKPNLKNGSAIIVKANLLLKK